MKIPDKAKKVFTGEIFDVYQWPQKMFDGSQATFEMLKRPDTVQIIAIDENDKILIAEERQPSMDKFFYSLFGGRIDAGEEPLTSAKRELMEESGYESNHWELLKERQPVIKMDWTIYTFIARNCKKIKNQNLDAGEDIKIKTITFEELVGIAHQDEDFSGHGLVYEIMKANSLGKLDEFKQKIFGETAK